MTDPVNHPPHYNQGDIECIQAIKVVAESYKAGFLSYCVGSVMKYLWRAPYKGNMLQDLKKARWYLDEAIRTLDVAQTKLEEDWFEDEPKRAYVPQLFERERPETD